MLYLNLYIYNMTKKIWLFVLLFVAIFFAWVSFADVIPDNSHYLERCVKLKNAEIDNYNVVYSYVREEWPDGCWQGPFNICDTEQPELRWKVVEYSIEKCLPPYDISIYLLDKKDDIDILTQDNIKNKAIYVWKVAVKWGGYVDNSNPLTSETFIYKIAKYGEDYELEMSESEKEDGFNNVVGNFDDYVLEPNDEEQDIESIKDDEIVETENNYKLELVETEQGIDVTSWDRIIKFWLARLITILIETIVLFIIAKLFRKEDQISNWRLLLIGILASTITLPLLRFVLPLFIVDGVEYTIIWELSVTFIEVFIIKYWLKVSRGKAIIASILCNLCSYLLGLLIL